MKIKLKKGTKNIERKTKKNSMSIKKITVHKIKS